MTRGVRLLYVDGDAGRRERVSTGLEMAGEFAVATDTDPESAVESVREDGFDCVLAHEELPEVDERAFPAAVRAADPDVALVLVTDGPATDGGVDVADDLIPEWALTEGIDPLARRVRSAVRRVEGTAREAELARVGPGTDLRRSSDVLGTLDADGRFEYVSPAAGRVLGYDPGDLAGREAFALVHPDDREGVEEAFSLVVDDPGKPLVVEFRLRTADGGWVPVENRSIDRPDVGPGILVYARDRSDDADDLRRIEAMVKHSSDVITVLDSEGVVRYESPAARRVKGIDPEAIVGENVFEFVHPDDHDAVVETIATASERPGAVSDPVEYRFRDDDGEWRWLESVGSNPGPDAPVGGFVVNTRNVTERVEREHQLRVLDRVLRHNVRNHLDVVMGHAERMAESDGVDRDDARERVLGECRDLLGTVDKEREIVELLTDSPDRVRVDLSASVGDAVERVRDRHPGATVEVACPPGVDVAAIPRLDRAVVELVENAVVHGDGPVEVTVHRGEGVAVVVVADRGPTIPDDEVGVLLDAHEIDQLYHGSGMGLWLVHWIVRRSGGDLAFEPREPRGNVVTVTLSALDPNDRG